MMGDELDILNKRSKGELNNISVFSPQIIEYTYNKAYLEWHSSE